MNKHRYRRSRGKNNCKDCTSARLCVFCQLSKNETLRNLGDLKSEMSEIDDEIESPVAQRIKVDECKIPFDKTNALVKYLDRLSKRVPNKLTDCVGIRVPDEMEELLTIALDSSETLVRYLDIRLQKKSPFKSSRLRIRSRVVQKILDLGIGIDAAWELVEACFDAVLAKGAVARNEQYIAQKLLFVWIPFGYPEINQNVRTMEKASMIWTMAKDIMEYTPGSRDP